MAISLKHAFTSPKSDGTDSTLVQPSNWNAEHVISLATGKLIGRSTAGTGNAEEIAVSSNFSLSAGTLDLASTVSVAALNASGDVNFTGTGAVKVPTGTTAQRPGTGVAGDFRFNLDLNSFEGYDGTSWGAVGGGAKGGGSNAVFYENDQAITSNYTITSGKNAMTAGPITVNSGITVTIPSGSVWTIV